ncbi:hypothetical protein [Shewanella sp.]|uniref:hypothetical protein n=1 Tax=Shewanella sp. TaxID=50422 RepID=UPI0040481FF6
MGNNNKPFKQGEWLDKETHKDFFNRNVDTTLNNIRAFQNQPIQEVKNTIMSTREQLSRTRDYIAILNDEIGDMQSSINDLPTSIRYRMDSTARTNRRNQLQARIRDHRKTIKRLRLSEIEPLTYRMAFLKKEFNL